jgi:hypothetical protein
MSNLEARGSWSRTLTVRPSLPIEEVMDERRGHYSGQVTHVPCRTCSSPVLLEAARMTLTSTHAELRCPKCDAPVRVRRADKEKELDGIWTIACYAEEWQPLVEPDPEPKRFLRGKRSSA